MRFSIEITGDQTLANRLAGVGPSIQREISQSIKELTFELQEYIQANKLSGQVLNVKTGALRAHIFTKVEENSGVTTGTVFISPSQVPYAGVHEFGGTIKHPGGTAYSISSAGSRFIPNSDDRVGILRTLGYVTKAHDIPMPERSYMRSGLKDFRDRILEALRAAVKRGVTGR